MTPMRTTFIEAAGVVSDVVRSAATEWDEPSVLTGRTIGGLAGHLSRAITTGGTDLSGDATTAYLLAVPVVGYRVVRSMVGGQKRPPPEPS